MTTNGHQVFGGRYELGEQIARGGTAQVFRARDLLLDRPVALKVLFSELSTDSTFVARFRREAQAAANLSHPNIVPIFDWGEADSTYFIVMEYVDGEALSSIIRTQAPLGSGQAASVAADIAKALAYAHRHGVVHRDIKPGNVLITSDGQVKVTDFGIARATDTDEQVTQTGLVMGTATYFSPEQAQGFAVDGRSDVYSLGVVLYEMVTGKPPFSGESPVSIAYQHVRERPQPPTLNNPSVPPPLEAVILQAMAKSPADRYQTADAMRADLDRFVRGQPVLARTEPADPATIAVAAVAPLSTPSAASAGATTTTKTRTTTPYWIGSGGVFAIAIGLLIYFGGHSLGYFGGQAYFAVPNVTGLSAEQASAALTAKGLRVVDHKTSGPSNEAGKVESQDPASPTTVRRGSEVSLYVVASPAGIPLPTVTSLTEQAAEEALKTAGFHSKVTFVKPTSPDMTTGEVVNESPGAGSLEQPGSLVILDVVHGFGHSNVPDLSGDTVAQATQALNAAGFQVGTTTMQASTTLPQGEVISTSPSSGQSLRFGQSVNLIVSEGSLIAIPPVVGDTLQSAETELSSDGLSYAVYLSPAATPAEVGTVVREAPRAGVSVRPNYPVKIYIGDSSPSGASGASGPSGNTGTPTT